MTIRSLLVAGVVLCVVVPLVQAGEADDLAAQAQASLRKADFAAAADAYANAAKADPANEDYASQARIVRRVIQLRERLTKTEAADEWTPLASALRSYYFDHQIFSEALPLDRKIHETQKDAASAATLARTELALSMDKDAETLLAALTGEQVTAETQVLLALAQARQGRVEQAKVVAATSVPKDATQEWSVDFARLNAVLGNDAAALEYVKLALEKTLPMRIDLVREGLRTCADFGKLAGQDSFATALQTASKVKASGCSGGASCGKCPSRGSCGSKPPAEGEQKDHAGCAGEKK